MFWGFVCFDLIFFCLTLIFFTFLNVKYWERQRTCMCEQVGGAEREERENSNQTPHVSAEPDTGFEPTNCEIITHKPWENWPELNPRVGHLTEWATQVSFFCLIFKGGQWQMFTETIIGFLWFNNYTELHGRADGLTPDSMTVTYWDLILGKPWIYTEVQLVAGQMGCCWN